VAEEAANGGSVYVHCGSGIGRAPTMGAAYLINTGLTLGEAWETIGKVRPFIRPTAVQVERIEQFAAQG
jgi:protein-tyrosine phosphatase